MLTAEWLAELEAVLMTLDDSPVECDGMTYAISYLLQQAGISHTAMLGQVEDRQTGDLLFPHCWIELDGGWIVDLRLRMWLGDEDRIPHGVFHRGRESNFDYQGEAMHGRHITRSVLDMLTEGRLSHVKVPPLEQKAHD